jgi:hypothetical protein
MSKSLYVEFRGQGFWAFDVVSSILLKHMVDVAMPGIVANGPWLGEIVQRWREDFAISDFGFYLDEKWTKAQIEVVVDLIEAACTLLEVRDGIPADEIEHWELLDGMRICTRGMPVVPTKPVITLGRAVMSLLRGTLSPAPVGMRWWYGVEDRPRPFHSRVSKYVEDLTPLHLWHPQPFSVINIPQP